VKRLDTTSSEEASKYSDKTRNSDPTDLLGEQGGDLELPSAPPLRGDSHEAVADDLHSFQGKSGWQAKLLWLGMWVRVCEGAGAENRDNGV
jgi:hypothetical protein